MPRASALVALVASGVLLTACAPAPALPAPLTEAEAHEIMDRQNLGWWTTTYPDEPMPSVQVVAEVDPRQPNNEVMGCVEQANIAGVTVGDDGSWSMNSDDQDVIATVNRAYFICSLRFPYDLSDPSALGMLSDEQQAWIWNYNRERLVPCLQLLGFRLANQTADYVPGPGAVSWSPYFEMQPIPRNAEEWARIDLRCPPPPVGPTYRPSLDELGGG